MHLLPYFLLGGAFGIVLVEAEVVSWFRVQEMFRFDAFHMYGIIGAAVATAALSLLVIRRLGLRGRGRHAPRLRAEAVGPRGPLSGGGATFGLGWALTGACPGPLVALVGAGAPVMVVTS